MAREYRHMDGSDLDRLRDLDRSERVITAYAMEGDELVSRTVGWDIPCWQDDDDEHSYAHMIDFCREHMVAGARVLGCLTADERLVGIGAMRPGLETDVAQLAFLHVSRPYRRQGLAAELLVQLTDRARATGARELYVSSAPTESAVSFYRRTGFSVTGHPNAELRALEPQDIHLRRPI